MSLGTGVVASDEWEMVPECQPKSVTLSESTKAASETCYWNILKKKSNRPFEIKLNNNEKIYYYLRDELDIEKVRNLIHSLHHCSCCRSNVGKVAGLFGPDGYALDFGGMTRAQGTVFEEIETMRAEARRVGKLHPRNPVFLITEKSLRSIPLVLGEGKWNGSNKIRPFSHLGLNLCEAKYITKDTVAARFNSKEFLAKLWNGTMDGTLGKLVTFIFTMLPEKYTIYKRNRSWIDEFEEILKDPELLRQNMWDYRIEYCKKIYEHFTMLLRNSDKANSPPLTVFGHSCGPDTSLSVYDQMHLRAFSLFHGGSYTTDTNVNFKSIGLLIEVAEQIVAYCQDDSSSESTNRSDLIEIMNTRTDPSTYMVQQVADQIEKHGVKSRFKIALAWNNKTDLDAWVTIDHGDMLVNIQEIIGYNNTTSKDGFTKLDFDANAGSPTSNPVENITLSDRKPGKYNFYVNNFHTRGNEKEIPFTVVINLDGEITTVEKVWDTAIRSDNSSSTIQDMMFIATIVITDEMINSKQTNVEMNEKQGNRFGTLLPKYQEIFGDKTESYVLDMDEVEGSVAMSPSNRHAKKDREVGGVFFDERHFAMSNELGDLKIGNSISPLSFLENMSRDATSKSSKKRKKSGTEKGGVYLSKDNEDVGFKTMDDIIEAKRRGEKITLQVPSRDFPPTYLTTHKFENKCNNLSKKDWQTILRTEKNIAVNTFYEEGRAPRQPDVNAKFDNCRFNKDWVVSGWLCAGADSRLVVDSLLKLSHQNYIGYFMALHDTKLPNDSSDSWKLGAGMYPSDLRADHHVYREIWQSQHTLIKPKVATKTKTPAIGVFLHRGRQYKLVVNGIDRLIVA